MKKIIGFFSNLSPDHKVYLFNLFCLLILYWPVTTMAYCFKWDMIVQYIPWRYHLSLSIDHMEFPLWNAHEMGGYPIHADPQSGAFYPIVWVLSFLFGKYSMVSAHIEFILTVFIASCCFYKLCRFFSVSVQTSAIAGLMYAGCGLFIGNTQHLTWVISSAYLPGIFYCFFALSAYRTYKHAIALAFFFFLHLTGGYPGFDIILLYLLIAFFIHYAITNFRSGQLTKYLWLCTLSGILTLIFSSGFIYSIYSMSAYISRGSGISMEMCLQNAFTLPSFLSFILPFATCAHKEIIGTDISMANAYFGIFFLLCLPFYVFKTKKTTLEKIILASAIVCLMASVGKVLPVREWMFHYFPMMDYFRFPSAFRIFVVIFLLLLAAIQLDKIKVNFPPFRIALCIAIVLFAGIILISLKKNYSGTGISDYFYSKLFFNTHSTIYDHILIQAIVQLGLLTLFLASSFLFKERPARFISIFILADLFLSVQLNLPYTSLDYDSDPKVINATIMKLPDITHIPEKSVFLNSDLDHSLHPIWKNIHNYKLEIAYDGYNPFSLKQYDSLEHNHFFKKITHNYPVYLAEKYLDLSKLSSIDSSSFLTNKIAMIDPASFSRYESRKSNQGDTCRIIAMAGNKIMIESTVKDSSTLVVYQNLLPGWRCLVNQQEQKIEPVNIALMGINIPPGKSVTELEYKPKGIYFLIFTNIISILLSAVILLFCIRKNV